VGYPESYLFHREESNPMSSEASNWGRWGPDDEKGTLNFITPEIVREAARLVRKGKIYSLSIPVARDAPIWPARHNVFHFATYRDNPIPGGISGAEDILIMHTYGTTHLEGLAHVWYDGKLYNGFPATAVGSRGTEKLAIDNVKGLVSRGVLLDIARLKEVDHLEKGYVITPSDIEDCLAQEGIAIHRGDVVLIRTGWINVFWRDQLEFESGEPGIGMAAAMWLKDREVSAVGTDTNGVEVRPFEDPAEVFPVHKVLLRDYGLYDIELMKLDELAADEVYEFLFVAAPLQIVRGLGSPINPLALA